MNLERFSCDGIHRVMITDDLGGFFCCCFSLPYHLPFLVLIIIIFWC